VAVALALAAAAVSVHGAGGAAKRDAVAFSARAGQLVVTSPAYRLTLSAGDGRVLDLLDRATGVHLLGHSARCLWGATDDRNGYVGGCSFAPRGRRSLTHHWSASSATLTLAYRSAALGSANVTIQARRTYFDLHLTLRSRSAIRTRIAFPEGLVGNVAGVSAGYAPNVLPGVRVAPAFFSGNVDSVEIYPSRWAFADYLALDVGAGHVALYSVARGPLRPVELGFIHTTNPSRCAGGSFCIVHEFQTWIRPGSTWTSPVVRVRVGETAQQSTLDYRHDNGIDAYPSLASKLGGSLATLAQAPLLKANLPLLKPFREWGPDLQRLPSPLLLHPVAFTTGGHDANDPDFLPPDPSFGTNADFSSMIAAAHARGDVVMPYLNLSWWDPGSPTMRGLPSPLQPKNVAVLDESGNPVSIEYGDHTGVIVSPYAPFVRRRVAQELGAWKSTVPADCLFLDQIGARPWLRDFNPAEPNPLAYDDGWLALLHPYAGRCLMAEDGWDRLARDFVGFHGGLLMMSRELDLPNQLFGAGNWQPYPLADWLFHDKVLLYQHDLFDATMAIDGQVLTWNMAFGLISSYSWDALAPGDNPWFDFVARLQRDFGPHYAGVPLSTYRNLSADATESRFGDLDVVANWSATDSYSTADGFGVAPNGFLARTDDGSRLAGEFEGTFDGAGLSPGTHDLLVERDPASVTVWQPRGADTQLALAPPASWSPGRTLLATATASDGSELGVVGGTFQNGRFVFPYSGVVNGRTVAAYRIAPAS